MKKVLFATILILNLSCKKDNRSCEEYFMDTEKLTYDEAVARCEDIEGNPEMERMQPD
jgi:hypothetical protein